MVNTPRSQTLFLRENLQNYLTYFLTILFQFSVLLVTTRRAGQRGAKTQSWAGRRIESDSVETESIGFGQDSTHRDSAYSRLTHLEGLWPFLKEQFSIYPLMQTFQVLTLESQSNMISSTVRNTAKSVEYLSKIDPKNATLFQKGRGGFDLKKMRGRKSLDTFALPAIWSMARRKC